MRWATLLLCALAVQARPSYWLSGGSGDGDCGLLITQRRTNGGMAGQGYQLAAAPGAASLHTTGGTSWRIHVSDEYGALEPSVLRFSR